MSLLWSTWDEILPLNFHLRGIKSFLRTAIEWNEIRSLKNDWCLSNGNSMAKLSPKWSIAVTYSSFYPERNLPPIAHLAIQIIANVTEPSLKFAGGFSYTITFLLIGKPMFLFPKAFYYTVWLKPPANFRRQEEALAKLPTNSFQINSNHWTSSLGEGWTHTQLASKHN